MLLLNQLSVCELCNDLHFHPNIIIQDEENMLSLLGGVS